MTPEVYAYGVIFFIVVLAVIAIGQKRHNRKVNRIALEVEAKNLTSDEALRQEIVTAIYNHPSVNFEEVYRRIGEIRQELPIRQA